jgi:hypothetical protein
VDLILYFRVVRTIARSLLLNIFFRLTKQKKVESILYKKPQFFEEFSESCVLENASLNETSIKIASNRPEEAR